MKAVKQKKLTTLCYTNGTADGRIYIETSSRTITNFSELRMGFFFEKR